MPCPPPLRPPRYQLRELLGKGSYGSVYRAAHADTGKEYAVKLLRVSSTGHARHPPSSSPPLSSHYDRVCVLNELRVLAAHECPFLVAFKEAYVHEGSLHIVTEWAQRGDLAHLLRARKGQLLRAPQVWHLFLPLCVAVDYLHQIRVLHRDLKPANVLVDAAGHVKLADLGIVKVMRGFGGNEMLAQTQIGTPCYMSPEVFKRERYGPSADVWSLGCVLHELLTLRPAFVAPNLPALRERVLRGGPVLPASTEDAATQPLVALCRDLLRVHPRARPTLPTLLARPAVRQELCARGLEALRCEAVVKPLFHTPCAVPRSLEEWTKVASLFGQLHATIRLEATDEAKLEAVDQLRDQLDARRRPLTRSLLTPPHPHPPPHPRPSPAHRRPVLFPVPSPNLPRPPHFQLVRMHAAAISRLRSARAEVTRLETLVEDLRKQLGPRPGRIPPVASSSPSVAPPLDDGIPRRAYEELPAETTTTSLRLPPSAVCPITHAPLQDPLLAADGHSYERRVIVQWLRSHRTSPVTGQVLAHRLLTPNHALRGVIAEIVADAEAA